MSEEAAQVVAENTEASKQTGSDDDVKWLRKEVERLRKENADRRVKQKEYEEAQKQKEEEDSKKRGEYEQLYTNSAAKVKDLEKQVKQYMEYQESEYASLTKDWSEDELALVPSSISITEKITLARKLAEKFRSNSNSASPTINVVPGVPTSHGARPAAFGGFNTELEWANAKPKEYLAYMKEKQGRK